MRIAQSTSNCLIWSLDEQDKREIGTTLNYMAGNGYYTIYGDNPKALDAEFWRIMTKKHTIIR